MRFSGEHRSTEASSVVASLGRCERSGDEHRSMGTSPIVAGNGRRFWTLETSSAVEVCTQAGGRALSILTRRGGFGSRSPKVMRSRLFKNTLKRELQQIPGPTRPRRP